jgi:nitrite reductase/ring-hydroxylating ferredoxin subunit
VTGWCDVGPLERFPLGEALGIRADGCAIVVTREARPDGAGDSVHAALDECPHLGLALAGGLVRRGRLACPHHAYTYDLGTGMRLVSGPSVTGPATATLDDTHRLDLLPARVVAGHVEVQLG